MNDIIRISEFIRKKHVSLRRMKLNSVALVDWAERRSVELEFIQPGKRREVVMTLAREMTDNAVGRIAR